MNISRDEVAKLTELSRIALSEAEIETMRGEIESILAYVAVVQKVELPEGVSLSPHLDVENVMREDTNPREPGTYTEAILAQAPQREGQYVKVKKILG